MFIAYWVAAASTSAVSLFTDGIFAAKAFISSLFEKKADKKISLTLLPKDITFPWVYEIDLSAPPVHKEYAKWKHWAIVEYFTVQKEYSESPELPMAQRKVVVSDLFSFFLSKLNPCAESVGSYPLHNTVCAMLCDLARYHHQVCLAAVSGFGGIGFQRGKVPFSLSSDTHTNLLRLMPSCGCAWCVCACVCVGGSCTALRTTAPSMHSAGLH